MTQKKINKPLLSFCRSFKLHLLLRLGDWALLRDVNSVEELTQILLPDVGSLLNLGGGKGDQSEVVTTELNLVLDVVGAHVIDSVAKLDFTDTLLSKEVADFHDLSGDGYIDGEMGVDEAHLVDEATGDSNNHVVDVGHDGPNASELLLGGEPEVKAELLALTDELKVHVGVLEAADELSTGSLDSDAPGGHSHGDALGNVDGLGGKDGLHSEG